MSNHRESNDTLPKLLSEAVLLYCKLGLGQGSYNIDGIICIESLTNERTETVVKIHRNFSKGPDFTNAPRLNDVENQQVTESIPCRLVSNSNQQQTTVSSSKFDSFQNNCADKPTATQLSQDNIIHDFPKRSDSNFSYLNDSDCEILDDSTQKQLFGELVCISDSELPGLYDVDLGDIAIKPDPSLRTAVSTGIKSNISKSPDSVSATREKADDSGSDEELKIEKLTAGRSRKVHRTRPAYKDVHGESVQVVSTEEYIRTLKSEKLKRSREKSPDFITSRKIWKPSTGTEIHEQANHTGPSNLPIITNAVVNPVQIASSDNANIQSIVTLPSVSSGFAGGHSVITGTNITRTTFSKPTIQFGLDSQSNTVYPKIQTVPKFPDGQYENKHIVPGVINKRDVFANSQHEEISDASRETRAKVKPEIIHIEQKSGAFPYLSRSRSQSPIPNRIDINPKTAEKTKTMNSSESNHIRESNETPTTSHILPESVTVKPESHQVPIEGVTEKSLVCIDDINNATQSEPHRCPLCTEVFSTFKLLDLHMYKKHKGNCMCPLCGKIFKQRNSRNRHIVAVHSRAKNFVCNFCPMRFTRVDSIKKHFHFRHPNIDISTFKFPYSYKRGEAIKSNEFEITQDTYHSDMMYIEEQVEEEIKVDNMPAPETRIISKKPSPENNATSVETSSLTSAQVLTCDSKDPFIVSAYSLNVEPGSSQIILTTNGSNEQLFSPSIFLQTAPLDQQLVLSAVNPDANNVQKVASELEIISDADCSANKSETEHRISNATIASNTSSNNSNQSEVIMNEETERNQNDSAKLLEGKNLSSRLVSQSIMVENAANLSSMTSNEGSGSSSSASRGVGTKEFISAAVERISPINSEQSIGVSNNKPHVSFGWRSSTLPSVKSDTTKKKSGLVPSSSCPNLTSMNQHNKANSRLKSKLRSLILKKGLNLSQEQGNQVTSLMEEEQLKSSKTQTIIKRKETPSDEKLFESTKITGTNGTMIETDTSKTVSVQDSTRETEGVEHRNRSENTPETSETPGCVSTAEQCAISDMMTSHVENEQPVCTIEISDDEGKDGNTGVSGV